MLVAHRGWRGKNRENRMVDFIDALKNCKAVEFDIRMTKDKKIIIFHDHNFKRICNVDKSVRTFTYDAIKQLQFFKENHDWLPALFVEDFVDKISNQYEMINVEIKADRYTEKEYEMLEQALVKLRNKTKAEIIVSSFSHNTLAWIKKLDSRFKKGYLMENPSDYDETLIKGFDYLHPYLGSVKRNPELYKKINLPMNIWTFKKDEDVIKVKEIYSTNLLNAFISDKFDLKI